MAAAIEVLARMPRTALQESLEAWSCQLWWKGHFMTYGRQHKMSWTMAIWVSKEAYQTKKSKRLKIFPKEQNIKKSPKKLNCQYFILEENPLSN